MGVKDSLMNKMISSMLGKVDFDAIQKQMGENGGKIDSNLINSVMSSMLGSKGQANAIEEAIKESEGANQQAQNNVNENEVIEIAKKKSFGYEDICKIIPQRPPFLMVDKVIDLDVEKKHIVCQKMISANEGFFAGHFPEHPVMPGVLMIEAMAQASSIVGKIAMQGKAGVLLFAEVDGVKFTGTATAGDVLTIEAQMTKIRGPLVIGECVVKKGEEKICCCSLKAFRKEL